jgi:hypothetical protein
MRVRNRREKVERFESMVESVSMYGARFGDGRNRRR